MNRKEIINGPGVTSGPEAGPESIQGPEIKGVTEHDLRVVLPHIGETSFVLQRNAKDERNPESPNYGALTPEAAEKTRNDARAYFEKILNGLPPEERNQVEILIVASDATLVATEGPEFNSPHKRSLETAAEVMKGAREALKELGVSEDQIINTSLTAIRARAKEDSRDIAEFTELFTRYGRMIHSHYKEKRLIVWAVSHYDSLSPFIKVNVLKRPATDYLPINAGG